jgi:two-component system, response regulator PdtaR
MTGTRMPRLVVVDDDGDLARELAGLFSDVGYEVSGVATAAREGINLVEQTMPDVVLMDVKMPGMSGTEAAGVLRRQHPELPVVLLSAYADEGIVKAARDADVAAYLVKGCTATELLSTVEAVVNERRQRSQPAGGTTVGAQTRSEAQGGGC